MLVDFKLTIYEKYSDFFSEIAEEPSSSFNCFPKTLFVTILTSSYFIVNGVHKDRVGIWLNSVV